MDGKRQVCEDAEVLPVLVGLLRDKDVEVQANAAGVIMNTVIITTGTNAHTGSTTLNSETPNFES